MHKARQERELLLLKHQEQAGRGELAQQGKSSLPKQQQQPADGPEDKLFSLKQQKQAAREQVVALTKSNSELIAKFRSLSAEARVLRKQRDELNSKASELRKRRNELYEQLNPLQQQLQQAGATAAELRGETPMPAGALQQLIEKLEWQLQTEALSPRDERELSKRIRELRAVLPKALLVRESGVEAGELRKKILELRHGLAVVKSELEKTAAEADAKHAALVKLFEKADGLRKRIAENLAALGEKRDALEHASKEFFGELNDLRRQEELEEKQREKKRNEIRDKRIVELKQKAEEIREKMRAGKKLSMEEFLVLQQVEQVS